MRAKQSNLPFATAGFALQSLTRKLTLIFLFFFLSLNSFGQIKSFDEFLKLFPKDTLPICIDYKDKEFTIDYFESNNDSAIPYQSGIARRADSIPISYAIKTLCFSTEKDSRFLFIDGSSDTIFISYFPFALIPTKKNFYCIIYECQYHHYTDYSKKVLCTFTKGGKLISKQLIASAESTGNIVLGNGESDDFARVPAYTTTDDSCIDNNLTITGGTTYIINANGMITEKNK